MSTNPRERRHEVSTDVVEEILTRLPVKHVLRGKLLSRTYYNLIKSPSFIKKHHLRQTSKAVAVVYNGCVCTPLIYLPPSPLRDVYVPPRSAFVDGGNTIKMAGSSNGLLCAVFSGKKRRKETLVLWNPATREHITVPYSQPGSSRFDCMGFGHDHTSDDYKFVGIWRSDSHLRVQVWSMRTNSWKEIETQPLTRSIDHLVSVGVLVRNTLYWLAGERCDRSSEAFREILISFNLVNHTLRCPTILPDAAVEFGSLSICEYMDSLALFICLPDTSDMISNSEVWMMDEDNNSWIKKFKIGQRVSPLLPSRISIDGEFLMSSRQYDSAIYDYVLYNPHTNDQRELSVEEDGPIQPWSYTETLVSPLSACNDLRQEVISRKSKLV